MGRTMAMVKEMIRHPHEIPSVMRVGFESAVCAYKLPSDPHIRYCHQVLLLVSRSFARVIQQLDEELRDAVCIFYVALRALDTVEDDMSLPTDTKTEILEVFYKHLEEPSWLFICGENDYRELMKNFHHLSMAYLQLSKDYRRVISDITKRMGFGMAEFIRKEVVTVDDYDKYCYYVAGLVGIGLSHLFDSSGLEHLDEELIESKDNNSLVPESPAISMGRFLQKVNIIRDYLEDINEIPAPRMFWPREIWGKYAPNSLLSDFKEKENEKEAVECLNHMITDCLRHAPECLMYMSKLQNPLVFQFCAVPQVMAIATAALCYNNPQVFKGVVKIRRGMAARIMITTKSIHDVSGAFYDFATILGSKIDRKDPSAAITAERIEAIYKACRQYGISNRRAFTAETKSMVSILQIVAILVVIFALSVFWFY